jgi:hypothetical protein
MRITPRLAFGLVLVAGSVACSSQTPFAPTVERLSGEFGALLTTPRPHATIPFGINRRNKLGLNLSLSVAGGTRRSFLFDTGSAGLWVYYNAIGPRKNYVDTHVSASNTYGSNIVYGGSIVYTSVDFGAGLIASAVPVVLVTYAGCAKDKRCPAAVTAKNCPGVYAHRPKARAGIYCLEEGRGLWGTFGADLEPKVVTPMPSAAPPTEQPVLYNALFAIAPWSTVFVVTPKELQLGPDPAALARFTFVKMQATAVPTTLPDGAKGWERDVPLCYRIGNYVRRNCANTIFDTGAFAIHFETAAPFAIPTPYDKCVVRNVPFELSKRNGTVLASFDTGYVANWNAVVLATPKPEEKTEVNTGLTFYNRDEIVFDARSGRVGLRPLQTPGRLVQKGCEN